MNIKKLPLAEELRPRTLQDIVGQDHILGENGLVTRTIRAGTPLSIVLWGPPGCGKTSIARLYAQAFDMRFISMSAIICKKRPQDMLYDFSNKLFRELFFIQLICSYNEFPLLL